MQAYTDVDYAGSLRYRKILQKKPSQTLKENWIEN
jgi:hypothetical protein